MISKYHFQHQRLQTWWVRPCGTACSIAVRRFFKESGSWFAVSVVLTAIIPHPMSCVIYCIFLLRKDWALAGKFNRHLFLRILLKNVQHTAQREWCKRWYDVTQHNLESFTYRYSGRCSEWTPLGCKKGVWPLTGIGRYRVRFGVEKNRVLWRRPWVELSDQLTRVSISRANPLYLTKNNFLAFLLRKINY